jgi:micrococcal nuclease
MAKRLQVEEPTTERPNGLFGSSTTIILLIFIVAAFWWSRRRRAQLEERLQAQRRERDEAAAESARNVAHIMRTAPRPGEVAAAASEGLAAAARIPTAPPVATGPEAAADADEARTRVIERAEAIDAAQRAAAEEAQRAAQRAEIAGEAAACRLAAAEATAEEARSDTVEATRTRAATDAAEMVVPEEDAAAALREAMRELDNEVEAPLGAVAGDGTAACPDGFPVKGNAQSRIYHEPGQVSYAPTVAEFCFASAEAAEAAGYRRSRARARRAQA